MSIKETETKKRTKDDRVSYKTKQKRRAAEVMGLITA